MATLTYLTTALTLPDDLLWDDEYAWQAVEQRQSYSVTGALVIEAAAKQSGRPITLVGGENFGWVTRATLETLRAWAALPGQTFALVIRGDAARTVMFDHPRGAIDARLVIDYADPEATDLYSVTLRFIEV